MSCRGIGRLLDAFVDGELPVERGLDVEQHLGECPRCTERERLLRAMKFSLRRGVLQAAPVAEDFQLRLARALTAERQREEHLELVAAAVPHSAALSWRSVTTIAMAAALVIAWAAKVNNRSLNGESGRQSADYQARQLASVDQLLEQFVDYHMSAPRPQVTEPALLRQFEPEVGVPLRLPSLLDYGARWEGGSVVPVNNQRAASLRYRMGDHRVTLYVYNSSRFPIESQLVPRQVRHQPVYVGMRRGLSIAARERYGVGYAIASDLNADESAELVASIY